MSLSTKNSAFFHTLVVVGGSLAACGGQAEDGAGRADGDGDGDGDAITGSGGVSGDGDVPPATGATTGGGTGGFRQDGDGDIIIIGSGGTPSAGGSYMGGAHGLGCPPEQWSCPGNPYDCSWDESEILVGCTCDLNRPLGPDDCADGTVFTCMEGFEYDASFNARTQPFSCACVIEQDNCRDTCSTPGGYVSDCYEPSADFQGYLCGCELPVLR